MAIIETRKLAKTFTSRHGPVEAVRGIDLCVNDGEIFGFLGPTVAGKTTTMRMTPVSRFALMLGMILVSLLNLVVQTALLLGLGLLLGFRPDAGGLALIWVTSAIRKAAM